MKTVALTKFTQREGLTSYYITKIHQDHYGFLWIGTQEGLNRFDGRSFQHFSTHAKNENRLGGIFVSDIIEDKTSDLLWVLTSYGDIVAINLLTRQIEQRLTRGPNQQLLSSQWVRCLALQGDTLWIGGSGILCAYDTKEKRYLKLPSVPTDLSTLNVSKIAVERGKQTWLFCDGFGIVALDRKGGTSTYFPMQFNMNIHPTRKLRFWDVARRKDEFYVATSWGLRKVNTRTSTVGKNELLQSVADTAEILCLAFGTQNQLYFATSQHLYSYDLTSSLASVYQDQNLEDDWLSFVYQLHCDTTANAVWVGTQAGLASFGQVQKAFTPYYKSAYAQTRVKHVFSLLPTGNNHLLCGDENGLYDVNLKTREIRQIDDANANYLLFEDREGHRFVSNKKGFFLLKETVLESAAKTFPELQELEKDQLSAALQYNDSLLLFSSVIQKGLHVWNRFKGRVHSYHKDSLQGYVEDLSIINNLYRARSSQVFILTEKSIIEFHPVTGRYKTHVVSRNDVEAPYTNFMDMCETKDSYWIATYGSGIVQTDKSFRTKRVFTSLQGISNNCVYRVFSYRDSLLFATTNRGLVQIHIREYWIKNYYESDGLHSSAFEQVCGFQQGDVIYAGGVKGFTRIDPSRFSVNQHPPKLYLNNVLIQTTKGNIDTTNIYISELEVPTNVLDVTVNFSALNFSNPERVRYAYKIVGVGEEWVDLGDIPSVKLIGLSPGTYQLMLRAANEDGIWNKEPYVLTLHYLPKVYQTVWFKIGIALAVLGLLYLFYRYRIAQIKKQQQIRRTIASDLHDDIGSALNAVKIFTHLAKKDPAQSEHLDHAEESLTQVTAGLRDIIWVLDDKGDNLYELLERVKKFALPLTEAKRILFTCAVQGKDGEKALSKTEKRNLLLIAKESINNAVKYADCTKIEVTLARSADSVQLCIKDDGKGFELDQLTEGNGLKNILYRAKQIHYTAKVSSSPDGGTIVRVFR